MLHPPIEEKCSTEAFDVSADVESLFPMGADRNDLMQPLTVAEIEAIEALLECP